MMLANATDTRMTATEVAERHEEKLLMLGPVLERLHNELLDPLIDTTFSRMIEAGAVPPPPEELLGVELNVEYVSVMAQAMKLTGITSIESLEILKVDPLTAIGTPLEIVGFFGGKPAYLAAIQELESALYQQSQEAA
jgi:hypothetical protein